VTIGITSIAFTGADSPRPTRVEAQWPPGASCTISITFEPTQDGSRTAMLSITDNCPDPQNVSLTGTGTVVECNPANLDFGVVQVGQSKNCRRR
jgi:hypothetical protein